MKSLEHLRAEPHLSVHSIRTWVDCPRRWRLKYVDRVKAAFRPVALALGTSIHRAVGYVLLEHGAGRTAERKDTIELLRATLHAEIHSKGAPVLLEDNETEDDLDAQATAMLQAILDVLPLPSRVIGVEMPFRLELPDDRGWQLALPLVGSIDVVTAESGRTVYTELKTAKRRWSEDQLAFDMQLTAYGMALRALGHDRPVPRLLAVTKAKTPAVQIESPHRGPQDERDFVATAASMLRGIKAGVDHPVRSWACKTCALAGACQ
jgi:hypothetical protein